MGRTGSDPLSRLSLPPGFRFYPTDEELMVQYLSRKVAGHNFSLQIIADIDLYNFDPWILPSKATFGEKEWYFFSPRDRKYPNGSRPNRVAGSGYWKATGTDKIISTQGRRVGVKKALVFYVGKAPKGTKTNWIMHEYRLVQPPRKTTSSKLDDWVLCRIYKKSCGVQRQVQNNVDVTVREYRDNGSSKPALTEQKTGFITDIGTSNFHWASLAASRNSVPELCPSLGYDDGSFFRSKTNEEVDSGYRMRWDENAASASASASASGMLQFGSGALARGFGVNSIDGFGFSDLGQPGGFGFM